ncbi:hypothetical protein ACFWBC_38525 [Streptomyces sp. NPDC059985]|uniref:hypothetical protein n=1 Tax=Streptomyces sp. NPDC059985 TaxID=3347025 RepID=UPI00368D3CB8
MYDIEGDGGEPGSGGRACAEPVVMGALAELAVGEIRDGRLRPMQASVEAEMDLHRPRRLAAPPAKVPFQKQRRTGPVPKGGGS